MNSLLFLLKLSFQFFQCIGQIAWHPENPSWFKRRSTMATTTTTHHVRSWFFASILIKMHWFLFLVESVFYHPILLQHLLICFPLFSCSRVQISCAKGIFPINTAKNVCKHKAEKTAPILADKRRCEDFLLISNNFAPNFCRPEKSTNNPLDWEFIFLGQEKIFTRSWKYAQRNFDSSFHHNEEVKRERSVFPPNEEQNKGNFYFKFYFLI